MANTKLTDFQKQSLRGLKMDAKGDGINILALDNKTTIAYKVMGNTVQFALAVKSDDEIKFRRKVGEYNAITRFYDGQTVAMAKVNFELMCEYVFDAYLIP